MVDSEDFTFEKIKTQEHSCEKNVLSDTFHRNATFTDNSSETAQLPPLDPNKKSEPQFRKSCSFVVTIIILVRLVIEDSICQKVINLNQNHILPFINSLKHPSIRISYYLVTVVEVIVINIEKSRKNFDMNLVLTHAQTLVQNSIIITPIIKHSSYYARNQFSYDHYYKNLFRYHIILLAQIIIKHPHVVHQNLTHVPATALLIITTLL